MNKSFVVNYSGVRLEFYITKENRIRMLYCGLDSIKAYKPKKIYKEFYYFAEAEVINSKGNRIKGLKHFQTSYGVTNKYVSHKITDCELGKELVITTRNDILEMETHFMIYTGVKGMSTYNVIKNISNEEQTLTYVPSFFQTGIVPVNLKTTYLWQAHNSWHYEAQWVKDSLLHLGVIDGNNFTSMRRYCITNTGGWSTKEHLPMVVVEDAKKKSCTLIQIENNGSWHIELGDFVEQVYIAASGPTFYDNQWMKKLQPGETFESVHASETFGNDFEETIQEITKVRRLLRRPSRDIKEMPVIFNDYMHALWDTQTTELILPLVDIAAKVNCNEFCMDAGWFAKGSDWWNILGVWKEHAPNFPNGGLKAVVDYIKSKGMGAGIWIEIEAVGVDSPALKFMKDGWLFKVGGKDNLNNNRYQLNFANPEVYQYAVGVIDELMKLYNLDYIKIDYNVDPGVGNEWHSDSLGDGLLEHNRAYVRWLKEIMDKYPNLTIENCGSGGCRMDNEILKYCSIQSTSDQTNYRKYPYLSTNVFTACTPEQAAVWSYPLNDYEKIMPTDEVVVMNMCNAMLGRIHLASFINKLPEHQLDLIREGIAYYHSISDFKKKSVPIYPNGISYFFDKEVVGGLKADNKIIFGVWNTSGKPRTVKVKLNKYQIKEVAIGYPKNIPTDYKYDPQTNILEVKFKEGYGGRIFEAK